tara:strand:+ start:253 stop:756 length:504 start_codon:yes stop_codon:yes gene_type:complete
MTCPSTNSNEKKTNNLGGPYQGFSATQTVLNYKDGAQTTTRKILRDGWNTSMAKPTYKGYGRKIGPFRAVYNAGDWLSRQNYACGGPNPMSSNAPGWSQSLIFMGSQINKCDGTGVPAAACNPKYVYDSSLFTRYKREAAMNRNYNDLKNGGDDHNASFVPLLRSRR